MKLTSSARVPYCHPTPLNTREDLDKATAQRRDEIIERLRSHPMGLSTRQIKDLLVYDCEHLLSRMITEGQLVRDTVVQKGLKTYIYRLSP